MIQLKNTPPGQPLEKEAYQAAEKELQERLYIVLNECWNREISCIVILEGWASSGKGDVLKTITARLDPRKFVVYAEDSDTRQWPFMQPYWRSLPYYGKAQFMIGSYYKRLADGLIKERIRPEELNDRIQSIINFERNISADRYTLFKFFLNISRESQKERMKRAKKDGLSWLIARADARQNDNYKEYRSAFEFVLNQSDSSACPWNIVDAENKNWARFSIIRTIILSLEARLGIDSEKILSEMTRLEEMA